MPTLREFERWLSTSQAAERMGKTRQGALWLAKNKRVRAVETSIGWLYDPEDVERVTSARTEGETEFAGVQPEAHLREIHR